MLKKNQMRSLLTKISLSTLFAVSGNISAEIIHKSYLQQPTTNTTPSLVVPTPLSPKNETTELSPTYQWKAVANATSYTIGMENPETEADWREYTITSAEANCTDTAQTCSYIPQEILTEGDSLAWWIKAINANEETGYSAEWFQFKVVSSIIISEPENTSVSPISAGQSGLKSVAIII